MSIAARCTCGTDMGVCQFPEHRILNTKSNHMIQIRTKEINKKTFICTFNMDGCNITVAGGTFIEAQGKAANIVVDNFELLPVEYASTTTDHVNHPTHYGGADNPYEVIKIIEHYGLNFSDGNVLKYFLRAGKKSKENELQDLEKAAFYLNRRISRLKQNK